LIGFNAMTALKLRAFRERNFLNHSRPRARSRRLNLFVIPTVIESGKGIITLLTLCLMFAIIGWTGRSSRGFRGGWSLSGTAHAGELGQGGLALTALHRPVMRMGLFVVFPTGTAKEEQDFLTVFRHNHSQSHMHRVKEHCLVPCAISIDVKIPYVRGVRYNTSIRRNHDGNVFAQKLSTDIDCARIEVSNIENFFSRQIIHGKRASIFAAFAIGHLTFHQVELVALYPRYELAIFRKKIATQQESFGRPNNLEARTIADSESYKLILVAPIPFVPTTTNKAFGGGASSPVHALAGSVSLSGSQPWVSVSMSGVGGRN
jgi:hypothetical protein